MCMSVNSNIPIHPVKGKECWSYSSKETVVFYRVTNVVLVVDNVYALFLNNIKENIALHVSVSQTVGEKLTIQS